MKPQGADLEGDDADPCRVVESVDRKLRWHQAPEHGFFHGPVGEQQVLPTLRHQPRPVGQRPGAVRHLVVDYTREDFAEVLSGYDEKTAPVPMQL
jgi:hypothetical protein